MIFHPSATKTIAAPSARVWAAIKNVSGLERWFPILESCAVEGEGVGALRTLVLVGGGVMKDRILEICEGERRLRYHRFESPFPIDDYVGTVEVRDATAEGAVLSWSVRAEVADDKAPALESFLESAFQTRDFSALIQKALADGVEGLAREVQAP